MNKISKIILVVILLEIIGYLLGLMTKNNLVWYANLNKSSLTPPNYFFGIAWSILYAILGYVLWYVWHSNNKLKFLFAVQMALNWSWTPVFFHFKLISLAAFILSIITTVNLYLTFSLWQSDRTISLLITPYILWLSLASYLNLYIVWFN